MDNSGLDLSDNLLHGKGCLFTNEKEGDGFFYDEATAALIKITQKDGAIQAGEQKNGDMFGKFTKYFP